MLYMRKTLDYPPAMQERYAQIPRAWIEGKSIRVEACRRRWELSRPDDLETLWNSMGEDAFADERIPYWTELWPASLALVSWLELRKNDIRNRLCLDLGCGLGLTAIIASWLGARVCAIDYEPEALFHAHGNARKNGAGQPTWIAMDWRRPAFGKALFWRVWAGDILYEKRFMEPVANFLDWNLARDGAAWIAEPGRGIFGFFLEEMKRRGWICREVYSLSTKAVNPQDALVRSGIWEIAKASRPEIL